MEFIKDHLGQLILIVINLVALIGAYFKLKGRVDHLEVQVSDIEKTRLRNVEALREIYDAKVMDAKKYSKGLFEIRESEIKELSKRMGSLESKLDKQSEMITQLIKTTTFIEATIKTLR